MWHAPRINAYDGEKIVCCERGQEALFPGASGYHFVDPRPEDKSKTARAYKKDRPLFDRIREKLAPRFPAAEFLEPLGEGSKVEKRYIRYKPKEAQGVDCDIVVCPRKRVLAPGRNWSYWPDLVENLTQRGYSVFAAGSAEASFDVPCLRAWDYERFLDATIEAILSSRLVVCTDSGLAHLAVQCGKPILVVMYKGRPGPGSNWSIKWKRYQSENHLGSPIEKINGWEDIGAVIGRVVELVPLDRVGF